MAEGPRYIDIDASSPEEGRNIGASKLGVNPGAVSVEVLGEKQGLFGLGRRLRLRVSLREAEAAAGGSRDGLGTVVDDALAAGANLDGYSKIDYRPDGVTLAVIAPEGKGRPVTEKDVLEEVSLRQIGDVDAEAVRRAVGAADGQPVIIAPPQEERLQDGQVSASVSADRMSAYLTIIPPRGGRPVRREDAMAALAQAGVRFGIDEAAVTRAVDGGQCRDAQVARGLEAVDGRDAIIEYKFEADRDGGHPVVLADGRVDFYNLGLIQNVNKGQVLAVKHNSVQGTDGCTVLGEVLPARPGKDVPLPVGKNIEVLDDGLTMVAGVSGQVALQNNKINVHPVYEVKGDVDLSTGNIQFVGSVVIRGGVNSGFSVKAEGDIEVRGYVDCGDLEAGGSIVVRSGIQGRGKGSIRAGGDVSAKFIENANVVAGKAVLAGEAIMHSQVSAGERVAVNGKKGLLVGGVIRAGDEVSAKVIGSALATPTEIEVGVNPLLREELISVSSQLREFSTSLDKTVKALHVLKQLEEAGGLPPDKKEAQLKLTRARFHLLGQIETLTKRKEQLEFEFEQSQRGRVKAADIIHPGVKVTVGRATMLVRDEIRHATLYQADAEIKIGAY